MTHMFRKIVLISISNSEILIKDASSTVWSNKDTPLKIIDRLEIIEISIVSINAILLLAARRTVMRELFHRLINEISRREHA